MNLGRMNQYHIARNNSTACLKLSVFAVSIGHRRLRPHSAGKKPINFSTSSACLHSGMTPYAENFAGVRQTRPVAERPHLTAVQGLQTENNRDP